MTDDELRRALAERLGEQIWKSPVTGKEYIGLPYPSPGLSELVATGEGRLTTWTQKEQYAMAISKTCLISQPVTRDIYGGDEWIKVTALEQFECITAPVAVRAKVLLETLE